MFFKNGRSWYTSGGQHGSGAYLCLFTEKSDNAKRPALYALARHVKLDQCGHFMMGTIRLGNYRFGVSGACGSDGLPKSNPCTIYTNKGEQHTAVIGGLVRVPDDIADSYWESQREPIRKWACDNHKILSRAGRVVYAVPDRPELKATWYTSSGYSDRPLESMWFASDGCDVRFDYVGDKVRILQTINPGSEPEYYESFYQL